MTNNEVIVTTPPDVVRIRASSTVLVKASKRVKRDFAGIFADLFMSPASLQKAW